MILTLLSPEGFRNWEAEEVNLEGVVAKAPLTPPSTRRREPTVQLRAKAKKVWKGLL